MKQVQKQENLQFFKEKEVTKLPLRLSNLQFFSEDPGAVEPPVDPVNPPAGANPGGEPTEPQLDEATKAFIEKMVQSAEDKVRTKYTKQLSATQKELQNYKTASMTAQEKAEYDMQELQKQADEREKVLHQKEMQWAATESLSEAGLDLKFVDFVIGADADDTKGRVAKLNDLFNTSLEAKVAEKFKAAGRDIYAGSGNGAVFTRQQVESMNQSDINANWTQIQKDMKTWTN
ncbi:DUF4355 domain-containing protein (plasmid) [Bacillus mycoides]|uniref:DUF4355 domain-containing protein n=1 Tax=Bacillus mycoides TaxID=1405 RepID=UPI001C02CFBE|nr:DUF4355 domain-containing protein [Bacillus mycoides]QWH63916.1 DUF4355 domain-containing protein [Bacillus mycoides]